MAAFGGGFGSRGLRGGVSQESAQDWLSQYGGKTSQFSAGRATGIGSAGSGTPIQRPAQASAQQSGGSYAAYAAPQRPAPVAAPQAAPRTAPIVDRNGVANESARMIPGASERGASYITKQMDASRSAESQKVMADRHRNNILNHVPAEVTMAGRGLQAAKDEYKTHAGAAYENWARNSQYAAGLASGKFTEEQLQADVARRNAAAQKKIDDAQAKFDAVNNPYQARLQKAQQGYAPSIYRNNPGDFYLQAAEQLWFTNDPRFQQLLSMSANIAAPGRYAPEMEKAYADATGGGNARSDYISNYGSKLDPLIKTLQDQYVAARAQSWNDPNSWIQY